MFANDITMGIMAGLQEELQSAVRFNVSFLKGVLSVLSLSVAEAK